MAASAARLARWFKPTLVLKKIDSRLMGNIESECFAIARELGVTGLLVVPAAPDVGRFVRHGHVVGAGIPEPLSIADKFRDQRRVEMPDVANAADLEKLAVKVLQNEGSLAVCSRGLAVALAGIIAKGIGPPFRSELPLLIAIGSRDPVTREQVEQFQTMTQCQILDAPDGEVSGHVPQSDILVVRTTGDAPFSRVVAKRFAEGLRRVVASILPKTIVLSGGDTAAAFLNAMNCRELEVCGEAAPGLPWCRILLNGQILHVISKSGGFGTSQTLTEVFAQAIGRPNQEGMRRG